MADAAAVAINLIRQRGSMRTPALAEELGIGEAAVDAMLEPASSRGELTTCVVETGGRRIMEYRCSASGGKYNLRTARATLRAKPPQHIEPTAAQEKTAAESSTRAATAPLGDSAKRNGAPASAVVHQGEAKVNLVDKIVAAFKKHGPMTTAQLREHHDHPHITTYCSQLAKRGVLGRLGGGKRTTIYGLPDQKAPETTTDAPPRAIHRKPPKHSRKRAGGGVRCNAA